MSGKKVIGIDERVLRNSLKPLRLELLMTQLLAEKGLRPRLELVHIQQRMAEMVG